MFAILMQVASTTTTTAAPEAVSKNPIVPSVPELVWGSFSFVILFILLWKFAFPGIKKSMAARTDRIRDSLGAAEKAKTDAEQILAEYQRQLADAKGESNRIIEEARATADALRRDLMAKAEADAAEVRTRATADIDAAKDRAMSELRTQLTSLTIELAEKVVRRNIDRETNTALIDEYIESISAGKP